MADLSDVETALADVIVQIVYPGGTTGPSISGGAVRIFRGWPTPIGLNADLAANVANISIFSDPKTTREATRYPRTWRPRTIVSATLTLAISGATVTFGGTGGSGQLVGLEIDGVVASIVVESSDTPLSVAAAVAEAFTGAVQNGNSVTFVDATRLVARVVGSGTSILETRRQEQGVLVSVWCSDPMIRDRIASSLDESLSLIDWLQFPDGSAGQLKYKATSEIDTSENANLYRRDLIYTVEYPTIITAETAGMLFGFGTINEASPLAALIPNSSVSDRPLVGAIRFDAFYDPQDSIDQQCAAALSNDQWLSRLPPNAVTTEGQVTWPLADQAVLDAEISAALQAGLSFWAFDSYQPGDGLGMALSLYLTSSLRPQLQFCMLGQISNWADPEGPNGYSAALARDISMMSQAGYLKVSGDRPVYFVLDANLAQTALLPGDGASQAISFVRQQAIGAGCGNPYIIWLSGAALADYDNVTVAREFGADAAGAYACPRLSGVTQSYAALVSTAETDWLDRSMAGMPMVGTAMTGWDQRPLIEAPQPFYPLAPGITELDFYTPGSPTDISRHVTDLMTFTTSNPLACVAGLALVYAWNELVEGGWLMPTYSPAGSDRSRVQAMGQSLNAWCEPQGASSTVIV